MAPQNKKAKLDHTPTAEKHETSNGTAAEEEDAEPAWIRYEDLEEDDIDDEYNDMVIQQKLLVNNEVTRQEQGQFSAAAEKLIQTLGCFGTHYRRHQIARHAMDRDIDSDIQRAHPSSRCV